MATHSFQCGVCCAIHTSFDPDKCPIEEVKRLQNEINIRDVEIEDLKEEIDRLVAALHVAGAKAHGLIVEEG